MKKVTDKKTAGVEKEIIKLPIDIIKRHWETKDDPGQEKFFSRLAIFISITSLIISLMQIYFAYDTIRITRKSLAIDKKIEICVNFLGEAKSLSSDLVNPFVVFELDKQLNSDESTGPIAALKAAGWFDSPFRDRSGKLAVIISQGKLLLPTQISNQMENFMNLASQRITALLEGIKTDGKGKIVQMNEYADLGQAIRAVEVMCGSLVEKDSI
jgi:hypothetical protein